MATTRRRPGTSQASAPQAPPRRWGATLTLFLILAAFWLFLSGRIGVRYFVFLALSVGFVEWLNPDRPAPAVPRAHGGGVLGVARAALALVRYLAWLVWNVIKANLQVAWMILHPRLPIDPSFLVVRSTLRSEGARVLMANAITLTPGTVTIDLRGNRFLVHSLAPEAAGALTGGELQSVVAGVFGEGAAPPADLSWVPPFGEPGA
ncbi:MAG TPA: Na+/H+ antiporter subunit E [Longimicrobiales bacterium]|nr:Na+/H+ antiporter subunit E [Longimicrobiales bacterium]